MKNLYLVHTAANLAYIIQADDAIEVCRMIIAEDEDELITMNKLIGTNAETESAILFCNSMN